MTMFSKPFYKQPQTNDLHFRTGIKGIDKDCKAYFSGIRDGLEQASQLIFSRQDSDLFRVIDTITSLLRLHEVQIFRRDDGNYMRSIYKCGEGIHNANSSIDSSNIYCFEYLNTLFVGKDIFIGDIQELDSEQIPNVKPILHIKPSMQIVLIPIYSFMNDINGLIVSTDVGNGRRRTSDNLHPLPTISEMIGVLWEQYRVRRDIDKMVRQYRAMINKVPAIMYIKDAESRYVEINQSFMTRIKKSREDIIGKTDKQLFPENEAKIFHDSDLEIFEYGKTSISFEQRIVQPNGSITWIFTEKVALTDEQGKITGLVGITQDTTEEHLRQQQLLQTDKLAAIGTLAAGVAHEINNPIGYISSNLNAMKRYANYLTSAYSSENNCDEKEKLNNFLIDFNDAIDESIEGVGRVKKIVADLKSFSRVDKTELCKANINEGIESTINIVWNELKYKCTLEKDLGDIPQILCYAGQINQVILNLLINAGQAIEGKNGRIHIKTWLENDGINISIMDNGIGISESNLNKIFDPFFTTKEIGKGTGLGLSLVYDIINKHDGTIQVQSIEGKGTEFHIWLPIECQSEAS